MPRAIYISLLLPLLLATAACSRRAGEVFYPDREKYEILGIDISAHNGEIDFDKVKAQGYEFVYIKATEGATFRDRRFIQNLSAARKAGLKVGAYHFFRFDMPGYMQGLNLAAAVEGRRLDLPVVIDLEEWSNPNAQATPLVLERLTEMIEHLEQRGLKVMIYTNKNGYARFIDEFPRTMPLWICSLSAEPRGMDWIFWQATHAGRVDGADHPVDINAFRGTRPEWERFLSGE